MIRSQACSTSAGVRGVAVGEDVGMPPDQLLDERAGDGVDVERLGGVLLGHPGVEDDLEQHVTELLAEVGAVAALDGLGHLVGLLDEVRREGLVGLLGVPGAAARRAQPVHGRDDVEQPAALHVPRPDDDLDVRGQPRRDTSEAIASDSPGSPSDEPSQTTAPSAARSTRRRASSGGADVTELSTGKPGSSTASASGSSRRARGRVGGVEGLPRGVGEQAGCDAGCRPAGSAEPARRAQLRGR